MGNQYLHNNLSESFILPMSQLSAQAALVKISTEGTGTIGTSSSSWLFKSAARLKDDKDDGQQGSLLIRVDG